MNGRIESAADHIHRIQDRARLLLGHRYPRRMAQLAKPLMAIMARDKCNELVAAHRFCRERGRTSRSECLYIVAAAGEMIDPSDGG